MKKKFFQYINIFLVLFFCLPAIQAVEKAFTIVIDAGHGGKDPGARGTVINEKAINLAVALRFGGLISDNHSDVQVLYTRKTDRFIELDERANIANRNKADLFISIHTNSVKRGSSAQGTETYTLGLARTDENLEVAMRENSAILLEDNYLQKYEGFDPNSSESYIIFEFMQNKHMEQSISFASAIQKTFTAVKREDRGVRQAGFLVLRKTSMPSVLVELGFISNRKEELFMKSSEGQEKLAKCLYNAFVKYKWDYDRKLSGVAGRSISMPSPSLAVAENSRSEKPSLSVPDDLAAPPGSEAYILQNKRSARKTSTRQASGSEQAGRPEQIAKSSEKQVNTDAKGKVIYKIQILTSDKKLSSNSKLFKGYKEIDSFKEKGIYKYTCGETTDFDEIRKLRRKVAKDFKDAFIVAFKNGERVKY